MKDIRSIDMDLAIELQRDMSLRASLKRELEQCEDRISQCLVRELQEELSLKCTVHGEIGRTGFTRPDGKTFRVLFTVR